ncbi:hypothetical protein FGB62_102g028 [Gracilaria domingensis]|nr:hypothetical protein FGB62_102g028 [Gracilaria domingensis]
MRHRRHLRERSVQSSVPAVIAHVSGHHGRLPRLRRRRAAVRGAVQPVDQRHLLRAQHVLLVGLGQSGHALHVRAGDGRAAWTGGRVVRGDFAVPAGVLLRGSDAAAVGLLRRRRFAAVLHSVGGGCGGLPADDAELVAGVAVSERAARAGGRGRLRAVLAAELFKMKNKVEFKMHLYTRVGHVVDVYMSENTGHVRATAADPIQARRYLGPTGRHARPRCAPAEPSPGAPELSFAKVLEKRAALIQQRVDRNQMEQSLVSNPSSTSTQLLKLCTCAFFLTVRIPMHTIVCTHERIYYVSWCFVFLRVGSFPRLKQRQ